MTSSTNRFSLQRLFLFAVPALPAAAFLFPLSAYLPPYYASVSGLSLATVGLIFTVARFWDIIIDPAMGALSDRTNSRFGRRRPWLVASIPVLMLGAWALFFPPEGAGAAWLFLSLMVAFIGYTMLTITHYAWAGDLTDDYHERSRLQGAIVIAGILGTLIAMILPAVVEGGASDPIKVRVKTMGFLALIMITPCILLSVLTMPEPARPQLEHDKQRSISTTIKSALSSKPFRRILVADFSQGIAGGMLLSSFVFFSAAWLALPDRAGLLLLIFFASGIIFVPGWITVSKYLGKARTVALSSALTIPVIAAFFFVPKGALLPAALLQILFGSTMGVWIFLTRSIIADLIDDEEATHGDRPGGVYYALATLTTKLGQALAVGVAYFGLDAAGLAADTLSEQDGLITAIFTLIPPILGHVIMIIMMLRLARQTPKLSGKSALLH